MNLSVKTAKGEFSMSNSIIFDWKSFLRDICAEYFIDNPVQLGGPGLTVEIMWRTSVARDPFDNIIEGIRIQYRQ